MRAAYIEFMNNDLSFCELRRLEVINGSDGRRLGHIIDMIFSVDGRVKGVILPYGKRGVFSKSQDLFIPFACLQKIGEDVIIVEINDLPGGNPTCVPVSSPERLPPSSKPPKPPKKPDGGRDDCDGKCEKCMLFDCAKRWDDTATG